MFHFAAHEIDWQPLYANADEALRLWKALVDHLPGAPALCVMPNHVHGLHPSDDPSGFNAAMRGYARYRNRVRGEPGRVVWAPFDGVERIAKGKVRIQIRYVHLNPCRARLVSDPLAWPLSTHRDAVGLVPNPVRPVARNPRSFQAYVSGDPSVTPEGTALPSQGFGLLDPERVADVVAGLYRVPRRALDRRGEARSVWIGATRALSGLSTREIGERCGASQRSVFRAPDRRDPRVALVLRVAHDGRFDSVEDLVLRSVRRR